MTYRRVLPRDLFNEADLLKCLGRLWILTEGHPSATFLQEDVPVFEIVQDESSGAISVANLTFTVHDRVCSLYRPLNARSAWPLYLELDDEEIRVFSDIDPNGQLSGDMIDLIGPR